MPLFLKMAIAFVLGIIGEIILFKLGAGSFANCAEKIIQIIASFSTVVVSMLKMIVIPIIFFSLLSGAASLPIKKFDKIGIFLLFSWDK